MPVNTPHPDYEKYQRRWKMCRLANEGEAAVKAAGSFILPRLSGQATDDDADYRAYSRRAVFFGAYNRAVEGLVGAVTRKTIQKEIPTTLLEHFEHVGYENETLDAFASEVLEHVVSQGRAGILVDLPAEPGMGAEPYMTLYSAEAIVNWPHSVAQKSHGTLSIVLKEMYEPDSEERDRFCPRMEEAYRELVLIEPGVRFEVTLLDQTKATFQAPNDKRLYVQLFHVEVKDEGKAAKKDGEQGKMYGVKWALAPTRTGGLTFDELPFVFVNAKSTRPDPEKPPLEDLCSVNMAHYRNSADYEHGLHYTGLPTPWVAGWDDTDEHGNKRVLHIGSRTAWTFPEHQTTVGMLEFTGQGLSALENAMSAKITLMAVLGARLLEPQRTGVETAEAQRIRQGGEMSVLAKIANTCSEAMTESMRFYAMFLGTPSDKLSLEFNTDFDKHELAPETLARLVESVLSNLMSWDTFYHILERGEMYADGWTKEDESAAIELGRPTGAGPTLLAAPPAEQDGELEEDEDDPDTEEQDAEQ